MPSAAQADEHPPVAHLGRVNLATRELVIEGFRLSASARAGQLVGVR